MVDADHGRADLSSLDDQIRLAVDADRLRACGSSPKVQHRSTKEGFPLYSGDYLTQAHLAALVHSKLVEWSSWDSEPELTQGEVLDALRPNRRDKALPVEKISRQHFLEAVFRVMSDCFEKVGDRLKGQEPIDYLQYLGSDPEFDGLQEFGFDPASIGFIEITHWNAGRMLLEEENVGEVQVVPARRQDWIDDTALLERFRRRAKADGEGTGSQCATLVGYQEDTREAQGQQLVLKVAES